MAADTATPLVSAAEFRAGAFADLVRSYQDPVLEQMLVEATRACETETGRRLVPFTTTETHRADGIDPDEYSASGALPVDMRATLGLSYAANLGGSDNLVRHCWLREHAVHYPEMWAYSDVSVTVARSYGGTTALTASQITGPENDTGHMWFQLGTFVPVGSIVRVTYSAGYQTIPADLARACKYMVAALAARELDPLGQTQHDPTTLESLAVAWLSPYQRSS